MDTSEPRLSQDDESRRTAWLVKKEIVRSTLRLFFFLLRREAGVDIGDDGHYGEVMKFVRSQDFATVLGASLVRATDANEHVDGETAH